MPTSSYVMRAPSSNGLYDVLELILDKGLVIDAYVRVSLVGIELLTIDARVVIASVDTYLRFAEATERLNLRAQAEREDTDMGDMVGGGGGGLMGGMGKAIDKVGDALTGETDTGEREKEGASSDSGDSKSSGGSRGSSSTSSGDKGSDSS